MELKQIKELMASMVRSGIKRLSIKNQGFALELERESRGSESDPELWTESEEKGGREYLTIKKQPHELPTHQNMPPLPSSNLSKEESPGTFITSPMVGTFYSSPSPEDPTFVKVGDKVTKQTVVCIIEAMKVMNEIKAGVDGTVVEVLVDAGNPVEFGTKLFRVS